MLNGRFSSLKALIVPSAFTLRQDKGSGRGDVTHKATQQRGAVGSCPAHQTPPERQSSHLIEGRNGHTRRFRLMQDTDKPHTLPLPL